MKTSEQITYTVLAMRDKQLAEQKKRNAKILRFAPIGAAAAIAITAGVVIAANSANNIGTSDPASLTNTTESKAYIDPYIMTEPMPENKPTTVWNGAAETTAPAYAPDTKNETAGGEETGTEATAAATAVMTTSANGDGGAPQTSVAAETAADTTAPADEVHMPVKPAARWEDRSMPQRFNWFNLSQTELDEYCYTGKAVASASVGESRGEIKMTGFDYYDDAKEYETTAELFTINSISESAAYAVKFDGDSGYYIFKHRSGYKPSTLGQLIDDTDLLNNITFDKIYLVNTYDGQNSMEYDPISVDSEKTALIKQLLSDCRDCKCEIKDEFWETQSYTVSVNVDLLGVENRSLAFFDSGYMMTNIMEYGYYFYIGADKVAQLRAALGLNDAVPHAVAEPIQPTYNSPSGEETTQPAHEPGEVVSEAHGPVVEGPSEGPSTTTAPATPGVVMVITSEE